LLSQFTRCPQWPIRISKELAGDSDSCVAFSFVKVELACRMFDSAGEYSNDEEADSGAKRQAIN